MSMTNTTLIHFKKWYTKHGCGVMVIVVGKRPNNPSSNPR